MTDACFLTRVQCPYCWEMFEVMIERMDENQQYIEDCQVCCQLVNFTIFVDDAQQVQVNVFAENDA